MKKKNTLDTDDAQIGRILSRREVLALLGGSSVALLAACAPAALASPSPTTAAQRTSAAATTAAASSAATALPSCIVRPALTEGPYFVDEKLDRSDIRSDPATGTVRPGALLTQKFLRGFQATDASGTAKFTTIYPGWYQGRAVHIHFKIRPTASSEFTSQLFFDDALSTQVFAQTPYSQKGTQGITRNSADGIFQQSGGKLTLSVTKNGDAYAATFDIGLAS